MTEQYFIGIDVAKANLDVFFHPERKHQRYANTKAGRQTLMADLDSLPLVTLVVFEASGGYERPLRQTLANAGFSHACVQPARVHAFLKAQGHNAKTDRLDAKALALFGMAGLARPSPAQDKALLALRDMTRTLAFIRRQNTALKCQMEKLDEGQGEQALNALLNAGKEQERTMFEEIKTLVRDIPELRALVECLSSMPGVGFYTACIVAAELPELGSCSKVEIAALTGTAPYTRQSGKWQGQAHIRGGRHHARKALYMAALTATRFNPDFKAIYDKLRSRGKPFKVAVTAIMRKMAIAMNAMIKNNKTWNYA